MACAAIASFAQTGWLVSVADRDSVPPLLSCWHLPYLLPLVKVRVGDASKTALTLSVTGLVDCTRVYTGQTLHGNAKEWACHEVVEATRVCVETAVCIMRDIVLTGWTLCRSAKRIHLCAAACRCALLSARCSAARERAELQRCSVRLTQSTAMQGCFEHASCHGSMYGRWHALEVGVLVQVHERARAHDRR
jgi:hypothetical protein